MTLTTRVPDYGSEIRGKALQYASEGFYDEEIGEDLNVNPGTVASCRSHYNRGTLTMKGEILHYTHEGEWQRPSLQLNNKTIKLARNFSKHASDKVQDLSSKPVQRAHKPLIVPKKEQSMSLAQRIDIITKCKSLSADDIRLILEIK